MAALEKDIEYNESLRAKREASQQQKNKLENEVSSVRTKIVNENKELEQLNHRLQETEKAGLFKRLFTGLNP